MGMNRAEWLAKRCNPVAGSVEHFWRPVPRPRKPQLTKAARRQAKKARMVAMYRKFFDNHANHVRIEELKFAWCIPLHPRLVRDTVLGSQHV